MTTKSTYEALGEHISKSQMFGCKNPSSGAMIAWECIHRGRSLLQFAERYHLVNGKLMQKAEFTLAAFRAAGGQCRWITTANDTMQQIASWSWRENVDVEIGFTMEDAKRAGLLEKGESNWKKFPSDMLQSRCATKAIKRIAPELLLESGGVTSPDEVSDIAPVSTLAAMSETGNGAVDNRQEQTGPVNRMQMPQANPPQPQQQYLPPPPQPQQQHLPPPPQPESREIPPYMGEGFVTGAQMKEILELFGQMQVSPADQLPIFQRKGLPSMNAMSIGAGDTMVAALTKMRDNKISESRQEAASQDTKTTQSIYGPVPEEVVSKIKDLITSSGNKSVLAGVRKQLRENGMARIDQMTYEDGRNMLEALEAGSISDFFGQTLERYEEPGNEETPF